MKVLVTGGTGFFACNLIPVLEEAGHEVYVTDYRQSRVLEEIGYTGPSSRIRLGLDIRSPGAAAQVVNGMAAVVHLAALPGVMSAIKYPAEAFGVNLVGTFNVLEAARATLTRDDLPDCKRVIVASTGSAADPTNPYAATKAAAEALCKGWAGAMGIEACALRFTNLYGPWCSRKGSVVSAFIKKALAGEVLTVDGDGSQERDFLHAEDAARAVVRALEAGNWIAGQTLTIGSGTPSSISQVVDQIGLLATDVPGDDCTFSVEYGDPRPVPEAAIDIEAVTAARDLLQWAPKHDLPSGVKTVWDWLLVRQDLVEEPESIGVASCELVTPPIAMGEGMLRIDFRDCRGKKRRKEVTRASLETWLAQLEKGAKTAEESERFNHQVAIEEATWLISLFPEGTTDDGKT